MIWGAQRRYIYIYFLTHKKQQNDKEKKYQLSTAKEKYCLASSEICKRRIYNVLPMQLYKFILLNLIIYFFYIYIKKYN